MLFLVFWNVCAWKLWLLRSHLQVHIERSVPIKILCVNVAVYHFSKKQVMSEDLNIFDVRCNHDSTHKIPTGMSTIHASRHQPYLTHNALKIEWANIWHILQLTCVLGSEHVTSKLSRVNFHTYFTEFSKNLDAVVKHFLWWMCRITHAYVHLIHAWITLSRTAVVQLPYDQISHQVHKWLKARVIHPLIDSLLDNWAWSQVLLNNGSIL